MRKETEAYIAAHADEAFALLQELAVIPAPSNHEERRAAFIADWLKAQGAEDVYVDDALNVVYPLGCTADNPLVVFMAHQDVVFSDTEALPLTIAEGRIMAPGIGDDTANLVALLLVMKYLAERKPIARDGMGVLLVADAGEEGLGNLKGSRKICETYGSRIRQFVSFDGYLDSVCDRAVGSRRYRVTVETEGGHSYGAFGNRNAIAYLASMIDTLYRMKVPRKGRTTYNVGTIEGGTSVNTIAQKASMLYEYRSDEQEDLDVMEREFRAIVEAYRAMQVDVHVESVGTRPCTGAVDPHRQRDLTRRALKILKTYAGVTVAPHAGSTDCNIPLSMGIPSLCLGCLSGGGAHTYGEWVDIASLEDGYRVAFAMVLSYFTERI